MRAAAAIVLLAGCSFQPGALADAPALDALVDAPADAALPFCPDDSHLRLCFSFDQAVFGATLANEGAAAVAADLTNVTRLARGNGGAAQLDTTSTIFVPMSTEVSGIVAIEIWYRADAAPPDDGERMGLVDSNVNPNISLFLYREDPGYTLRCGLGEETATWQAPIVPGSWFHLVCACQSGNLEMYVDGMLIGATPAACTAGGAIVTDGLTIGSNNAGGPTDNDAWLVGAIDGIKLWDVPVVPAAAAAVRFRP